MTVNPAATNADTDTVRSVTAADISLATAMKQALIMTDHPKVADRRNSVWRSPYGADAHRRR
jgi:hypothetical protein